MRWPVRILFSPKWYCDLGGCHADVEDPKTPGEILKDGGSNEWQRSGHETGSWNGCCPHQCHLFPIMSPYPEAGAASVGGLLLIPPVLEVASIAWMPCSGAGGTSTGGMETSCHIFWQNTFLKMSFRTHYFVRAHSAITKVWNCINTFLRHRVKYILVETSACL